MSYNPHPHDSDSQADFTSLPSSTTKTSHVSSIPLTPIKQDPPATRQITPPPPTSMIPPTPGQPREEEFKTVTLHPLPSDQEKIPLTNTTTPPTRETRANSGNGRPKILLRRGQNDNYSVLPHEVSNQQLSEDQVGITMPPEKDEGWKPISRELSNVRNIVAASAARTSSSFRIKDPGSGPVMISPTDSDKTETWAPTTRTVSSMLPKASLPRYSFHTPEYGGKSWWGQLKNTVFAIGVIYGDLGTSVIYTLPSVFKGDPTREETIGCISLLLWALFMTVSIKYVIFLMSCDYHGEGGSFALYSVIRSTEGVPKKTVSAYTIIAFIGASMLIGDGIITPAVSVLSAMEGLAVYSSSLTPAVLPVSIVILVLLFLLQRFGTNRIGKYFGPVMVLWFLSCGALGLYNIIEGDPSVCWALLPHYGLKLLFTGNGFDLLGGIVLSVTGCEAMFADMGHFGKRPIRLSWNILCFPNLVLCYLGQGALLLKNPDVFSKYPSPYYGMVPRSILWPIILLACASTVIASQSLITGASSIVHQAVKLQFFPRVRTYHTSKEVEGQIYIPAVNYVLMVAVVAVCLGFQTSVRLGNAFGMAVTFDMVFTSFFFVGVMYYNRHYHPLVILPYVLVFFFIDFGFLTSNLKKFVAGGWLPIFIAAVLASIMTLWHQGSMLLQQAAEEQAPSIQDITQALKDKVAKRCAGTAFFFSPSEKSISPGIWSLINSLQTLPRRAVLLNVRFVPVPFVSPSSPLGSTALFVENLGDGLYKVTATFGYAQSKVYAKTIALDTIRELDRLTDGPKAINEDNHLINGEEEALGDERKEEKILYLVCREHMTPKKDSPLWRRLFVSAFNFLARNAPDIANSYHIPTENLMEMGVRFMV